jgi:tRNA-dihydrouridine synthase A
MIGRRAYQDPFFLAKLEQRFLSGTAPPPRRTVVERMLPYIERRLAEGERLNRITRHMLGLFANEPGARAWRRYLSEHAHRSHAGPETLLAALDAVPQAA